MLNKVILVGRVVKKPTITATNASGLKVSKLTLAINKWNSKVNNSADFIPVVTFGKLAEVANTYLDKGTLILVEGRISNSNFVNKDNQKVYGLDIIANTLSILGGTNKSQKTPFNPGQETDELSNQMYQNFKTEIPVNDEFSFYNKDSKNNEENDKEEINWE